MDNTDNNRAAVAEASYEECQRRYNEATAQILDAQESLKEAGRLLRAALLRKYGITPMQTVVVETGSGRRGVVDSICNTYYEGKPPWLRVRLLGSSRAMLTLFSDWKVEGSDG